MHAPKPRSGAWVHLASLAAVAAGAAMFSSLGDNGLMAMVLLLGGTFASALTGHALWKHLGARRWLKTPRQIELRPLPRDYRSASEDELHIDGALVGARRVLVNSAGPGTSVLLETEDTVAVVARVDDPGRAGLLAETLGRALGVEVRHGSASMALGGVVGLLTLLALACDAVTWATIDWLLPGFYWPGNPLLAGLAGVAPWLLWHAIAALPSMKEGRDAQAAYRAAFAPSVRVQLDSKDLAPPEDAARDAAELEAVEASPRAERRNRREP